MDLKERDALGDQADRHWYYVSKARMVSRYLPQGPRHILDVGAGLGWFSRWMLENKQAQSAICVDPGYEKSSEEYVGDAKISYVRSVDKADSNVVFLMDVLEHVDDDVALLKQYLDDAPIGTTFIVTVPAFEFLWSAHDDYLEHRRRYTTRSLAQTVRQAGAEPTTLHYYFGAIFPLVVLVRLLRRKRTADSSDMSAVPEWLNRLLTLICELETKLTGWNRLAGLSVVAKFEKDTAAQ